MHICGLGRLTEIQDPNQNLQPELEKNKKDLFDIYQNHKPGLEKK